MDSTEKRKVIEQARRDGKLIDLLFFGVVPMRRCKADSFDAIRSVDNPNVIEIMVVDDED